MNQWTKSRHRFQPSRFTREASSFSGHLLAEQNISLYQGRTSRKPGRPTPLKFFQFYNRKLLKTPKIASLDRDTCCCPPDIDHSVRSCISSEKSYENNKVYFLCMMFLIFFSTFPKLPLIVFSEILHEVVRSKVWESESDVLVFTKKILVPPRGHHFKMAKQPNHTTLPCATTIRNFACSLLSRNHQC